MNNVVVFKNITSANIMVFSRGISVKNESMSELPMKLHESCSTISVAKLNESLTVYLLVVNDSEIIGTINFASLYVSVKADKIGLKSGQLSSSHWFQMSPCFFEFVVKNCDLYIKVDCRHD